jgi:hypothetical protein
LLIPGYQASFDEYDENKSLLRIEISHKALAQKTILHNIEEIYNANGGSRDAVEANLIGKQIMTL